MNEALEVLRAHQPESGHRSLHQHCTCGWVGESMARDFLEHQSEAVEAVLAAAWSSGYWHGTSHGNGPLNDAIVESKNPYKEVGK